jgi:hypothetical protein
MVGQLRGMDLAKRPGVAETIDWANALHFLGVSEVNGEAADGTLGAVIKDHDDEGLVRSRLGEVVGEE